MKTCSLDSHKQGKEGCGSAVFDRRESGAGPEGVDNTQVIFKQKSIDLCPKSQYNKIVIFISATINTNIRQMR